MNKKEKKRIQQTKKNNGEKRMWTDEMNKNENSMFVV